MNETAPASPLPSGDGPKKGSFFKRLLLFLLLALLAGGGYVAWEAMRFLETPAQPDSPQTVRIEIAPGATFDRVAWDLYKAGAVTNVSYFRLLARFQKKLGAIQAGEFEVNTGWTPEQLLTHLTSGRAILYRLSIREGLPWWDVARIVEESGFASAEEFKAVIHDPEFLRRWGIPFANAEGFLFPETYLLRKPKDPASREQAEEIANLLVGSFWKHSWPIWKEYAVRAGEAPGAAVPIEALTIRDGVPFPRKAEKPRAVAASSTPPAQADAATAPSVQAAAPGGAIDTALPPPAVLPLSQETLRRLVILSTLVEKETGVPEERARVSGVYTNRMRIGMLLQCDPTILYGLGESYKGPIRKSHLADAKNRYNTYQHPGLPPGPICSAGLAAIRAAANPEEHKFLYFVANGGDGSHSFSTNIRDHQRAVERYRAWERSNRNR
ncbi:endolytic transglycosylase MltG [Desulfovibrio sp. OttesenSCG-928-I05]|nr:endolytic transglycosylase MltG [Desulfovibrio sp. OttesenSCG-928-I05]